MSKSPPNPSPDIQRLINEGYEVEIRGAWLLIHQVPYVASNRTVQLGTLVSELTINGDTIGPPKDHIIHFAGDHPCFRDGSIMQPLRNDSTTKQLGEGIVINHSFSNKPSQGYPDYYQKVVRYVQMIWAEAHSIDPTCKPITFRVIAASLADSVFNYIDTNSARAAITSINDKLKGLRIAIIGLGGTGAYVLDAVAKTPVAEIHLHDCDTFDQHNAFRAPGAASVEDLGARQLKTHYYAGRYGVMRRGIVAHSTAITRSNVAQLIGLDFVFLCVDHGPTRAVVIPFLHDQRIPFVDVGMGVEVADGKLRGTMRTTASTSTNSGHIAELVPTGELPNGAYHTNIQIVELNMLNAAHAVIRWKKLFGFYEDVKHEHHCTYTLSANLLCSSAVA